MVWWSGSTNLAMKQQGSVTSFLSGRPMKLKDSEVNSYLVSSSESELLRV